MVMRLIPKTFGELKMIFKRSKNSTNGSTGTPASGPSIIAQDVTIEGNITASGELHIDGTVFGSVRAKSCVIDMNGFVQGELVAEEIFIRGRVMGPIRGLHVNLYAGAQVEGDILNETISIENGANIYGMISRAENPLADGQSHQSPPAGDKPAATSTMSFGQVSYLNDQPEDNFRPLKVIRPV
jgi:cytoskeletal protein CcmA (bactofilin family)